MRLDAVRVQLSTVFERAIETGVSVQQNFPSVTSAGGLTSLGVVNGTAIALRNIPYTDIYTELEQNESYHIKLPDGGLLLFQYRFDSEEELTGHRLCYFPSPSLPTFEEAPDLYDNDALYGDIVLKRIVRFPVRFDFDPLNYKPRFHAHSHLSMGQFENFRIPVSRAVAPIQFLRFILQNFYFLLYRRHMNSFEKNVRNCHSSSCITSAEAGHPYLFI